MRQQHCAPSCSTTSSGPTITTATLARQVNSLGEVGSHHLHGGPKVDIVHHHRTFIC